MMPSSLHGCFVLLVLLLAGCGGRSSDQPRTVSPYSVNISGVTLFQTSDSLRARLPFLHCEQKDADIKICTWHPSEEERKLTFRGIDQLKLTFYKDTLQAIAVQYAEMMDLEYRNFNAGVRTKYARSTGIPAVDTSTSVWQYDSLIVTLVSNKKAHWTGSLLTYTPILEFQERTLYRRWMDALEKRNVNPVY